MIIIFDDDAEHRSHFPFGTLLFITSCVIIFFITQSKGINYYAAHYGVVPSQVKNATFSFSLYNEYFTLFTSIFLHSDIFHLILNMIALWAFSRTLEDKIGTIAYILVFIGSGIVGSLLHVYLNPTSQLPMIGASGAVYGVMGAYLVFFPMHKLKFLIWVIFKPIIFEVRALFIIGIYLLLELGGLKEGNASGIAHAAHVGGLAFGYLVAAIENMFTPSKKDKKPDSYI